MTRNEYDYRAHRIGWLTTMATAYEDEHDWEADIDPDATREGLAEVRAIHDELIAALGVPEPVIVGESDPNIPF